jgi:hypothetical protein
MSSDTFNPFNPEICFDTIGGRVCIPILSTGPTFPQPPAEGMKPISGRTDRFVAMGAGDIHASTFRKLRREFEAVGRDRRAFAGRLISQLKDSCQILESEERDLLEIVGIVFGKEHADDHIRLRCIYEQLIDQGGTPMAITLAGIASDSANFVAETDASEGPILTADFLGAVAGAVATKHWLGAGVIGGTASFLAWW